MEELFITAVVFYCLYEITKLITNYLLKRRIVKSGHIEKAGILDPVEELSTSGEANKYPSLKWGLVAFMGGLGLILTEILQATNSFDNLDFRQSTLPFGIELVFISMGFLIYFVIVNFSKRK